MRHLASAAVLSAFIAIGSITSSSAAPISLGSGDFTGAPGSNSAWFGTTANGSLDQLWTFSLATNADITISVTNSVVNPSFLISDFTLSLYEGSDGTGAPVDSVLASAGSPNNEQKLVLNDLLTEGPYSFRLSGTASNTASPGGSLSISISPVPLPASAPLFGAAILALGLLGHAARQKRATSGAA